MDSKEKTEKEDAGEAEELSSEDEDKDLFPPEKPESTEAGKEGSGPQGSMPSGEGHEAGEQVKQEKQVKQAEQDGEPGEGSESSLSGKSGSEEQNLNHLFALRTTANREDQVMDFVTSNAQKKKLEVYSVIRPHGMRGYIFMEAKSRNDAEQAAFNVPYARGILSKRITYSEIEHMLEQVKKDMNIRKNDICEIISGPFKREKAKITRIDKTKEEVVVELLESAVPIPITVKMDSIKVIRRDKMDEEGSE